MAESTVPPTPPLPGTGLCPRLVREGAYSRRFCNKPADKHGVCRYHRRRERQAAGPGAPKTKRPG